MHQPDFYGKSLADLIRPMPFAFDPLAAVRRQAAQRFARMGNQQVRRLLKANQYRAVALAGGGAREVARRQRQLAKIAAK